MTDGESVVPEMVIGPLANRSKSAGVAVPPNRLTTMARRLSSVRFPAVVVVVVVGPSVVVVVVGATVVDVVVVGGGHIVVVASTHSPPCGLQVVAGTTGRRGRRVPVVATRCWPTQDEHNDADQQRSSEAATMHGARDSSRGGHLAADISPLFSVGDCP